MEKRKEDRERSDEQKTRDKKKEGGDLKHIIETGLPPGISEDEAIDPGSQTPRNPVDDRS